jgi:hypothetical protein
VIGAQRRDARRDGQSDIRVTIWVAIDGGGDRRMLQAPFLC